MGKIYLIVFILSLVSNRHPPCHVDPTYSFLQDRSLSGTLCYQPIQTKELHNNAYM